LICLNFATKNFGTTPDRRCRLRIQCWSLGKVNVGLGHVVEVVGENVQCDVGHDFGNGTIVERVSLAETAPYAGRPRWRARWDRQALPQ
jgi:hypothetical protein